MRVLTLASVLALAPVVTGLPQASTPTQAHPVESKVRQVGFVKSSVASMRAAKNATRSARTKPGEQDPVATARSGAVSAAQDVSGAVTVVGVTWPKGAVSARDQFQIRTLTGSTWSQWQSLDGDPDDGPDRAEAAAAKAATSEAGGTSPYIVTGASKYEVRSLTADPTAPTAAKIQVVDPGTSDADRVQSAGSASGAAAAATAKPAIYTRAAWGADESLRKVAPAYGRVQVGFVHHTVSSNSYTADQVPAMIRGMYAYHVNGQGWNDIGYNFLVDRFGRTWEGRYGGMDRPVVGAQTLNYNSVSTGVSAIGNFAVAAVPPAMTAALKRILAWKLSLAGLPAIGSVVAGGKSFQRISGHRDGFSTACPGQYLYDRLPEIRAGAAALIAAQPSPDVTPGTVIRSIIRNDLDRNGTAEALSYRLNAGGTSIDGSVSLLASARRVPVRPPVSLGTGWNVLRSVSVSPDLTGDGKADIIAQDPRGNRLRIYRGNGRGGFAGVLYRGSGWNALTRVVPAGDRNRDGRNDILATRANGALVFYRGNGRGSVSNARVIGTGFHKFKSLTYAGDLNGDRLPDLLAIRRSDGVQLMFAGGSGGSLRAGVRWGTGWGPFSAVVGGRDLDGDRYPDLYARRGGGMSTYSSDASGRFVRVIQWGSGWAGFTQLSAGADWNGDGAADLLAVNPAASRGRLLLYAGTGQRDFQTLPAAFPTVPGADLVRLVGDVNGDGYTDAVARVQTGDTLVVLLGLPGSGFAAPRQIGTGWNALPLIEAAGDYDGDGVPDLLARDTAGNLFVYLLNRNLTFKSRTDLGGGYGGMLSVVGVGAFDRDVFADVVALRASDHALVLFRGTGNGGLGAGTVLANAQNDLAQILGVGDYTGDGRADLMSRAGDGRLWVYPGNVLGALAGRQLLRGGQGAGHVLG